MADLDQARTMLVMAEKDLRALTGMLDRDVFADEVFGFHGQQAVEKTLKAWLCIANVSFPKIHDLDELFALISDSGETIPDRFRPLSDLTDFAVQFGYAAFDVFEAELDRTAVIEDVQAFFNYVNALLK